MNRTRPQRVGSARIEAEELCKKDAPRFKTDSQLLEYSRVLFQLRLEMQGESRAYVHKKLAALEAQLSSRLHKGIKASESQTHILSVFRKLRLNRLEKEIILVLCNSLLGMITRPVPSPWEGVNLSELQRSLKRKNRSPLDIIQAVSEGSRLASEGLVNLDPDGPPAQREVEVSADFLTPLLQKTPPDGPWKVRKYEDLLDMTSLIVRCLERRCARFMSDHDDDIPIRRPWRTRPTRRSRSLDMSLGRHVRALDQTLKKHKDWPLAKLFRQNLDPPEKLIVLALLGKDLGFLGAHSPLLSGRGLAAAVSTDLPDLRRNIKLLRSSKPLRKQDYVQVIGGLGNGPSLEDDEVLEECEFELTDRLVEKLKIKRRRKTSSSAREPVMDLEQLVLHPDTVQSLSLVMAQFENREVFADLEESIPYGTGLAVLFWGPPGTGKTATAEGLANELDKPIIVVDYSEVQSAWVGQTEKNIVRMFHEASDADAILFFDEADALFYDRDGAMRSWEVRDVNVLLQEIERFDGLCILSTNRQSALDKALNRRVTIKVEFRRPNRKMREKIWKKIMQKNVRLANDVDFRELSEEDLSGGEIKNAILNAARIALSRGPKAKVGMTDLKRAIEMEEHGDWAKKTTQVGFRA